MFLTDEMRDATQLNDAAHDLVGRVVPGDIPLREAQLLFDQFASLERIAAAGKTLFAARVAESNDWKDAGHPSPADWLASRCGTSAHHERRSIATGRRLRKLAETDAAFRRGDLSLDQANEIAGAASHNAEAEAKLLDLAGRASLRELRDECLRAKTAADPDPDATHDRIHRERRVRTWTDAEGAWNLHARGTADAGAEFMVALNHLVDDEYAKARSKAQSDDDREPREALAFDAFMQLGRDAWDHRTDDGPGACELTSSAAATASKGNDTGFAGAVDGQVLESSRVAPNSNGGGNFGGHGVHEALTFAGPDERHLSFDENAGGGAPLSGHDHHHDHAQSGGPNRAERRRQQKKSRTKPNPRNQALLRLDVSALWRGYVEGDELCEITGIGPIPVQRALDMLTDSVVKLVITKGVDVVHVTHLGRKPTEALRAAILWQQPQCSVEGCNRMRIEYDHRIPWAETRHTKLDELDGLCPHHHRLKSNEGWELTVGTGKRPMVPPTDPRHPANQARSSSPQPTAGADAPDLFDQPQPDDLNVALQSLLSPAGV